MLSTTGQPQVAEAAKAQEEAEKKLKKWEAQFNKVAEEVEKAKKAIAEVPKRFKDCLTEPWVEQLL